VSYISTSEKAEGQEIQQKMKSYKAWYGRKEKNVKKAAS
jgi:hypothetical protein